MRMAGKRPAIDLRSDTLTTPSPSVWKAMAAARVGSCELGEDLNVCRLEETVAGLSGLEAGYFVATGRMANIIALMTLRAHAFPLICERRSHLATTEARSVATIVRAATYDVDAGALGVVDPDLLERKVREVSRAHGSGCLVALENTHNVAGGCTVGPADMAGLTTAARRGGARAIYVDGARLWNAAVALGAPLSELLVGVDGAMLSLSKGLGAPFGAVLVGRADFIRQARQNAELIGASSVHRLGYLAAAAQDAIASKEGRLEEDHRRARLPGPELV
jgi:threonine aldolase